MISMERVYYHFRLWEDFKNGLYNLNEIDKPGLLIKKCASLLKDNKKFYDTMIKVITEWRHSTEVNMTNTSRNRQAWLGQSSCCYLFHAPEYITKIAWRTLTQDEQQQANDNADKIINLWEKLYSFHKKNTPYDFNKLCSIEKQNGLQQELSFYS